jgi:hypothetical protein
MARGAPRSSTCSGRRLSVRIADVVALDDVPDVHARVERGTPGRIVVAVNPW